MLNAALELNAAFVEPPHLSAPGQRRGSTVAAPVEGDASRRLPIFEVKVV